jgi:formylglycine-generating enzyme required for sulfatase activity
VRIRAGEFWMGSDDPMFRDARPWHQVSLDAFYIDKTLVTNEQFARFVKTTGYLTIAEKTPTAQDFPGAPPESRRRARLAREKRYPKNKS